MMAILTENYGGKWPFWLSPRQAIVVPVSPKYDDYAKKVSTLNLYVYLAGYLSRQVSISHFMHAWLPIDNGKVVLQAKDFSNSHGRLVGKWWHRQKFHNNSHYLGF